MARAIQTLRRGESIGQQDEAMQRKAAMVGFQAMLGAVGHSIQADGSRKLQEQQKNRSIMSGAIDDATRKAGLARVEAARPSPDYVPNAAVETRGAHDVPSWLSQAQGQPVNGPDYIKEAAKSASDNQNLNSAAAGANIGGYRTPGGLDGVDQDSDSRAADIMTGKNIMKATENMGGMMGSLPRR